MNRKPSLREAHAVRDREADRRRELLDLVGHAVLVAVGDGPDLALARADERHHALRADRHVARVRHDGVEADLEAARQLDAGEIFLDRLRLRSRLRNLRDIHRRSGGLELGKPLEIARARLLRMGERRPHEHKRRGGAQQRVPHVFLPVFDLVSEAATHHPEVSLVTQAHAVEPTRSIRRRSAVRILAELERAKSCTAPRTDAGSRYHW